MLDDDLSELSDASDMSMDSAQPSQLSRRSKAVGAKRMKRASKQDKDGKLYHVVGLYAGEADAVASTSSRRAAELPNAVLPTPIHFGAKLLTEEREFCLPYPIHQSKDQLRDKVNAKRKPPRYHLISKNKYFSRPKLQGEVPLCSCKPGSGCGADCINRMLQFICDPKTCPSASNCTNISLGRRPSIKTTTAYYGRRGFGLKTLEPIKQDDFIDEYRGEVIDLSEAGKRVTEEYKATGNYYLLDYDSAAGELLDGGRKGNITRFANHSCDPNCRIEKFIICGTDEALSAEFQIGLFANRDIEAGEELTYNYGWAAFQPRDNLTGAPTAQVPTEPCLCGAVNCSGILGGKKATVPKGAADEMKANSRTKTAKGRGKGKGKTRKAGPGSRVRMRAMTPLLTASRLSAAAMPSSALLSPKVGRSSRKREQAQASLNLLNKMVLKRQERSAREAAETASSASAPLTGGSMDANATRVQPNGGPNDDDASAQSVLDPSAKGRKAASTSRVSALSGLAGEPAIAPATSIALSEALTASASNASKEAGTSQSAATSAQANGDSTPSRAAASGLVARLPILKKFGAKRTGGAFGRAATAARGTKDRRWTAAEALTSDDDDTSSLGRELSDSDEPAADAKGQEGGKKRRQASTDGARRPGRRGRHKLQLSGEEAERRAAERRARNAFLARVRRASKRGIVIEDPTQHPLKKISIECAAAPDNTYIPDLPSSLVTLGMSTADARRARNAFLARVRRAMKRGYVKEVAIKMAAKPLPGDPERDTPIMRAQRTRMEKIQQEAADELYGRPRSRGAAPEASGSQAAAAGADESWVDESSWAQ
uniref:Histone-lysine N-methyltransferase n=2 Tax=Kalmanozyma brasiliensis (strain GHG001) TaxID=1365824 RepID=V5F133_KALBG